MKIYIDILLVTNAIMTLIMLEAAGRICHKVISPAVDSLLGGRAFVACYGYRQQRIFHCSSYCGDKAYQCGIHSAYSLWV